MSFSPASSSLSTTYSLKEGLGWRLQLFIFLIVVVVIVSRRPDAVWNPEFYAEDGVVWYAQAYNLGWLHSLTLPVAGYFSTLPRLTAGLALLFPLRFAPLVMNICGILVQALPVTILLSPRCSLWTPFPVRVLQAAVYIALPNSREIHVNVTNAQWHFALAACLIAFAKTPANWRWKTFDMCAVLIGGLTGPFCFVLLPLVLVFYWIRRQKWSLVIVGLLTVSSMVQLSEVVFHSGSAGRPSANLGASFQTFSSILASHVYAAALIGENTWALHAPVGEVLLVTILGSTVIIYCVWKGGLEIKLFACFCLLIFAASLRSPMVGGESPKWEVLAASSGTTRYWFLPMLAFQWSLLWCAAQRDSILIKVTGIAGLAISSIGMIRDWKYPPLPDMHFYNYVAQFETTVPGNLFVIPIYPDGWSLQLRKRIVICRSLPVGSIDVPGPDSKLTGLAFVGGWAAASEHIKRVSVYVDGVPLGSVGLGVLRPDVDRVYGNSPDKLKGWQTTLDLSRFSSGRHKLEASALKEDGCYAEVAARSFDLVP